MAAGDAGAAVCDWGSGNDYATQGIAVSGYASSPYVVAVGGTTFADWALGTETNYWNSQNGIPYWGSAKSYIPEIAWNSSCGNERLAYFYTQQLQTYGLSGFCNNSQYLNPPYSFLIVLGGSGGPSSCALTLPGSTSCTGYPKPSWQSGILGNPSDQARDVPDVSIFAGGGEWGHALVYCQQYEFNGSGMCTGDTTTWLASGGTSFSAPIFAGIQALVDERIREQVGNPSPTYYAIAKAEYGQSGNPNCVPINVTAGNHCVFYDVSALNLSGDSTTVVPCRGQNNCYRDGATYGVLSTQDSGYAPAFASQPGWDFTTGIGTPNVTNLVDAWPIP